MALMLSQLTSTPSSPSQSPSQLTMPQISVNAIYVDWYNGIPPGTVYHMIYVIASPDPTYTGPLVTDDTDTPEWAKNLTWIATMPMMLDMFVGPNENVEERLAYFQRRNHTARVKQHVVPPDTRSVEEKYCIHNLGMSDAMVELVRGPETLQQVIQPVKITFPEPVKYFELKKWGDAFCDFKNIKTLTTSDASICADGFTQDDPFYHMLACFQNFNAELENPSQSVELSVILFNCDQLNKLKATESFKANGVYYDVKHGVCKNL